MRNIDLIHSIAKDIVDKHYEELEECECEENECECEDDFYSMFEVPHHEGFWDKTPVSQRMLARSILISAGMVVITSTAVASSYYAEVPVALSHLVLILLLNIAFYANRLNIYGRVLSLAVVLIVSMLLSSALLCLAAANLLVKLFSG